MPARAARKGRQAGRLCYSNDMAEFFKQAPAPESLQKRLFDSIFHKQSVVGSFPLSTPLTPLYAFPAMMLSGLAIVLCVDDFALRRNLDAIRAAGYDAPDVLGLGGEATAAHQQSVFEEINRQRARLLFVTPESFCSFRFLPVLARERVSFLAIEDAHRLLPGYGESRGEDRALQTLGALRQKPPLALFSAPLSDARRNALLRRVSASNGLISSRETFYAVQETPSLSQTRLSAQLALTERQKFNALCRTLAGVVGKGNMGGLFRVGSALIRARDARSANALLTRLHRVGFESLFAYHDRLPSAERERVAHAYATQRNAIVVAHGPCDRMLLPPPQDASKILYWQFPVSLEEALAQLFQVRENESRAVEGVIFYTRDDYQEALSRAQWAQAPTPGAQALKTARIQSIRLARQWLLSDACRVQGLLRRALPEWGDDAGPCGLCDVCASHARGGFLRGALRHWLY